MKKKSWRGPTLSAKLLALKAKMEDNESEEEEEKEKESHSIGQEIRKAKEVNRKKEGTLSCQLCFKVFGFRNNLQRHLASGKCNLLCDEGHDHDFIFRKFTEIQEAKDYIADHIDPSKEFIIRNSRPKSNYFVYVCSKRESQACFARFSLQEYKPKSKHTSSLKSIFVLKGCLTHSHLPNPQDSPSPPIEEIQEEGEAAHLPSFQENVTHVVENFKELSSILESLKETPENSVFVKNLLIESSTNISRLLYSQLCRL